MVTEMIQLKTGNLYGIRAIDIRPYRCRAEIARDAMTVISLNPNVHTSLLAILSGINGTKLNSFLRPLISAGYLGEIREGRTRRLYITEDGKEFLLTLESVCDVIGVHAGGEGQ